MLARSHPHSLPTFDIKELDGRQVLDHASSWHSSPVRQVRSKRASLSFYKRNRELRYNRSLVGGFYDTSEDSRELRPPKSDESAQTAESRDPVTVHSGVREATWCPKKACATLHENCFKKARHSRAAPS